MTAPAAALMDRIYRHQRHVYDATRKYYLLGRDRVIAQLDPAPGDAVLEIGCGTARNLILAARRYPQARFFGLDVSAEMLATAAGAVARAGLAHRIRLAQGDATSFDPAALFGEARFVRIFISYSLSMIPPWAAVVDRAVALLQPGGNLQIVDFGGQEDLPRWFRLALRRWLALFHVFPRDTLERRLACLALRPGVTLTIERPFRGYTQHAILRLSA